MSPTPPVTPCSGAGWCPANSAARARTSSVSSSSRQATATTVSTVISGIDRWSATENIRISLDLVAPELHPHRMLGGRRENVENATADREFAALADHVHPGIGQLDQPGDDVFERQLVADGQRQRLGQAQPRAPSAAAASGPR